jgi:hypothetical protein
VTTAAHAEPKTLAGTWAVQVSFVTCDTAVPTQPTFPTLHTYLGENAGSMIEHGGRVGPPPTVSRTVAQGTWQRVRGSRYEAVYEFFRFDGTGAFIGSNRITRDITLGSKGLFFSSTGTAVGFDAAGTQIGVACLRETGLRKVVD